MIYVFRPQSSMGAKELKNALGGKRLRFYDGTNFFWQNLRGQRFRAPIRQGDAIVCWGADIRNPPTGVKILNGTQIRNKFQDALTLKDAGVATIEVARERPAPQAAPPDPALALWFRAIAAADEFTAVVLPGGVPVPRTQPLVQGVTDLLTVVTDLQAALRQPPPAPRLNGEWFGRMYNHVGGNDILSPTPTPQYWVKKEAFTAEYRVHSFLGKSLRAGRKVTRDGFIGAHAWVRSWDGGWKISYDGVSSKQRHRDIAHAAVSALGLDFGAVDIGEKADGSLMVLEVNRAPGIELGTLANYAQAIQAWADGQ